MAINLGLVLVGRPWFLSVWVSSWGCLSVLKTQKLAFRRTSDQKESKAEDAISFISQPQNPCTFTFAESKRLCFTSYHFSFPVKKAKVFANWNTENIYIYCRNAIFFFFLGYQMLFSISYLFYFFYIISNCKSQTACKHEVGKAGKQGSKAGNAIR